MIENRTLALRRCSCIEAKSYDDPENLTNEELDAAIGEAI